MKDSTKRRLATAAVLFGLVAYSASDDVIDYFGNMSKRKQEQARRNREAEENEYRIRRGEAYAKNVKEGEKYKADSLLSIWKNHYYYDKIEVVKALGRTYSQKAFDPLVEFVESSGYTINEHGDAIDALAVANGRKALKHFVKKIREYPLRKGKYMQSLAMLVSRDVYVDFEYKMEIVLLMRDGIIVEDDIRYAPTYARALRKIDPQAALEFANENKFHRWVDHELRGKPW